MYTYSQFHDLQSRTTLMNVFSLANVEKMIVTFAYSIIRMPGSGVEHVDENKETTSAIYMIYWSLK